ncbi:hypothetical protein HMI54_004461 [Coelomomyces lativittatus]|nr:hypothetical protein HMI56_000877 [Coelomomyces lativittatus]KAJ1507117.1 hypothetical protein HMI54_004461 [Coelomomyces lativittatus]
MNTDLISPSEPSLNNGIQDVSSRRRSTSPNYQRRVSSARSTSLSPSRKFLKEFLKSSMQEGDEVTSSLKSESSLIVQSLETELPQVPLTQFSFEDLVSHVQTKLKESISLVHDIQHSMHSMEMEHLHVNSNLGQLQDQLRHAKVLDIKLQKSCETFRKSLELAHSFSASLA